MKEDEEIEMKKVVEIKDEDLIELNVKKMVSNGVDCVSCEESRRKECKEV
jgi:hypothetical protein